MNRANGPKSPVDPLPPGWEAFAAARARGLNGVDAYAAAGYSAKNRKGAAEMAARDRVRERIEALTAIEARLSEAGLAETVIDLARAAHVGMKDGGKACLREVRHTLLAAQHIGALIRTPSATPPAPARRDLTNEEWMAKYGKG